MTEYSVIEEAAAHWLVRRDGDEWSAQDQRQFDEWYSSSVAHRVSFLRLERLDRSLALLAEAPAEPERNSGPDRPARWPFVIAVVAVLALTMVASTFFLWRPWRANWTQYATTVGGGAEVLLRDGTRLDLNTDTLAKVSLDGPKRAVDLEHGEIYFRVAHDTQHPFEIAAGERRVSVLGTSFSVRRDGDKVHVAVVEGRVWIARSADRPESGVIATAGDVVDVDDHSLRAQTMPVDTILDRLSWRQGRISLNGLTLAEAVAEFNRYQARRIVVSEPRIGGMRLGGSFATNNVDGFLRLLRDAMGLKVQENGERVEIRGAVAGHASTPG